jgi:hypothetical protein
MTCWSVIAIKLRGWHLTAQSPSAARTQGASAIIAVDVSDHEQYRFTIVTRPAVIVPVFSVCRFCLVAA